MILFSGEYIFYLGGVLSPLSFSFSFLFLFSSGFVRFAMLCKSGYRREFGLMVLYFKENSINTVLWILIHDIVFFGIYVCSTYISFFAYIVSM
jgi:hypothetical protein